MKVMMPEAGKAKKVSVTPEMMSRNGGYPGRRQQRRVHVSECDHRENDGPIHPLKGEEALARQRQNQILSRD